MRLSWKVTKTVRVVLALTLVALIAGTIIGGSGYMAWGDEGDGIVRVDDNSNGTTEKPFPDSTNKDKAPTVDDARKILDDVNDKAKDTVKDPQLDKVKRGDEGIGKQLKDITPVSEENMSDAKGILAPVGGIIGKAIGVILIIVVILFGLVTAIDIVYILLPFTRGFIATAGTNGTGAMMAGSGHMMNPTQSTTQGGFFGLIRRQWVSDEAVSCAALIGGSAQAQSQQVNGFGGGAMYNTAQNNQMGTGTVLGMYFKKRLVTLVMLGVCMVVLFTSAIMGFGINIGAWLVGIIEYVSGFLS